METLIPEVGDRIKFSAKGAQKPPIRKVLTVDRLYKTVTVRYNGKPDFYVYFYEILKVYNSKI